MDSYLKAMEIFKDGASEFFDLDLKITAPAETEIKSINIKTNAMDYLFYTDNGEYLHLSLVMIFQRNALRRLLV